MVGPVNFTASVEKIINEKKKIVTRSNVYIAFLSSFFFFVDKQKQRQKIKRIKE